MPPAYREMGAVEKMKGRQIRGIRLFSEPRKTDYYRRSVILKPALSLIAGRLREGRCVPFLGAAANVKDATRNYTGLPLGGDVAQKLAAEIPNVRDPSNLARALLVLQSAGLIELEDGGSIFSTVADIDESKSKVKVTPLEASLTATSLPDVAAAVINNDFVEDAGLSFEDAIAKDDPTDPNALPYVNIFASRAQDADNETYLKLVEIFQTDPDVQAGLDEASAGTGVSVEIPVSDLEASLADVEDDTRAQG